MNDCQNLRLSLTRQRDGERPTHHRAFATAFANFLGFWHGQSVKNAPVILSPKEKTDVFRSYLRAVKQPVTFQQITENTGLSRVEFTSRPELVAPAPPVVYPCFTACRHVERLPGHSSLCYCGDRNSVRLRFWRGDMCGVNPVKPLYRHHR